MLYDFNSNSLHTKPFEQSLDLHSPLEPHYFPIAASCYTSCNISGVTPLTAFEPVSRLWPVKIDGKTVYIRIFYEKDKKFVDAPFSKATRSFAHT